MRARVRGADELVARVRRIAMGYPRRVGKALYQEAQIEMTESKRRVPVQFGTLRASGFVEQPEQRGQNVSVTLSYGTEYAIYVHENLEAFHKNGQAKFLESVLDESAPFMAERLGRRLDLNNEKEG